MPLPDDPDDEDGFVPPLHPDDRLWRHPSEMAAARRAGAPGAPGTAPTPARGAEPAPSVGTPRAWTVAAASVLIGVAATLAVLSLTGTFDEEAPPAAVERVQADLPAGGDATAVTDQVGPALVRVDASLPSGDVTATGVVFRSDGHLLTTADAVVGATTITVTTSDGSVLHADVVGVDTATDVAVLSVPRHDLPTAVMAQVADLAPGADAVAVGLEPDADGPAVAAGHVSALGLRLDTADGTSLHDMIQTVLETSPTTAGAVLCNRQGAVLGVLTARDPAADPRYTQTSLEAAGATTTTVAADGMSTRYATPIDYAAQVADEIIDTGTVRHTWLGVVGDDLDPDQAARLGRSGATLTRVVPDGPAAVAGLVEGDVVVAVDGVQTTSMSSLVVALRAHHPGDEVSVSYVRDGEQRVATVTLTDRA